MPKRIPRWLDAHPLLTAVLFSAIVASAGYFRLETIVENNRHHWEEVCMREERAWNAAMDYLETVIDNEAGRRNVHGLREAGSIDCNG